MSASGNHLISSGNHPLANSSSALLPNGVGSFTRARTPVRTGSSAPELEVVDDDPRTLRFREIYAATESKIDGLFRRTGDEERDENVGDNIFPTWAATTEFEAQVDGGAQKPAVKKSARKIDEDDYDDESEDDDEAPDDNASPLKGKSTGPTSIPRVASPSKPFTIPPSPALTSIQPSEKFSQGKSAEDVRKSLEEDKKAAEDAVKRDFQLYFYPLDNDKENMLEQQKLEEVERQADMEMNGQGITSAAHATEGTLSQANLGASSLAFKYLIARVDAKRDKVEANDQQLRNLLVEVKKNRSKWASEDKIGQEELYEAAEKVLGEIKAGSEYSQPFLTKVNKREAPDYYIIIKHPMDLSQMTKKLKMLQYKSKKEFVDDLNYIWENCLKYNSDPAHPLRKNAKRFQKEVDRLSPLIPDVTVRDRAEVEAEERRAAAAEIGDDNAEDSDDEPIIAARGRKAPGKKAKKGAAGAARKAPPADTQDTPAPESKPSVNGILPGSRTDMLRADSEMGDGSQHGFSTPPAGTLTPAGINGIASGSQHDLMDVDGVSGTGPVGLATDVDYDDPHYKLWKQVTKKDRAHVTAERNRLFRADRLDPERPAPLRTKAGMRRWVRQQPDAETEGLLGKRKRDVLDEDQPVSNATETLAEGMEETEERVLPDYYDPSSAMPSIHKRLKWTEDLDGAVNPPCEEALRTIPSGYFKANKGNFTHKMAQNIRQMQETRKICKKIEVVKQMQLQTQIYANQFQKYEPEPVEEQDIEPAVVSDEGAIMNSTVCHATMRRSVAQICYAAGFEEYQPSALDALGELALDYFVSLATSLKAHLNREQVRITERVPGTADFQVRYKPFYTPEEAILLTLYNKSIDIPELHRYATEDTDKLTTKLGVLHERMKAHLADLLRPALEDGGEGGVKAFDDGSEQFVGGDFAEELGEDFFGFKELGLDKDFGFNSLSVPLHLLQNRMHNAYAAQNNNSTVVDTEILPSPANFPSVSLNNPGTNLGIVKKWVEQKLSNANKNVDPTDPALRAKALTEDEDLPQKQRFPKPRLPPNGKITSPRKKPVRETGPGKGHPKKSMRYVEGHGWLKNAEADEVERKMREDEKRKNSISNGVGGSAAGAAPKTPSKLRIQTGGTSMSRQDSRMTSNDGDGDGDGDADEDADGDADDADEVPPPPSTSKIEKNKDRPNGFISPVSIEAH